jgi:hypothetical protein
MAGITILEPYSQTPGVFFDVKNFLAKSQTQPLCRIGIGEDLVGGYEVNPDILGDPVVNNARTYSLTPKGFSYSLSTSAANGSIQLHPAGGKYLPGTVVTVIVKSNFGYKFNSWGGDLSGAETTTTITMDRDKSISANFETIPTFELKSSASNGIVRFNPSGSTFEEGTKVSLKAIPDFGYRFSGWSGDIQGVDNPVTVVMDANKSITASFTRLQGTVVFATNCGGSAFTASDGIQYAADTKYTGGTTYSTGSSIAGTTDDALYRSERYGNSFSYNIPLPNGTYQVMLMFAENFNTSADKRVFDVAIEGAPVISHLDIWAEAGANTAYNDVHLVTLKDEMLNISFTTIKDNAKISAIKILQIKESTGMNNVLYKVPNQTKLTQVFPNPFSAKTTIQYQLNEAAPVKLSIYNSTGELITTLVDEQQAAGYYSVDWNTKDHNGKQLENGLFLFKLESGRNSVQTMKAILSR